MAITPTQPQSFAGETIGAGLSIIVRAESTHTVVALLGEADSSTAAALSDALSQTLELRSGDVVIDLSALVFIDSATGRILAATHELLERRSRRLAVRSPSRLARIVLGVFGLTELIEAAERGPSRD